jgi:catechol 2,3-dioxygenase-like lactoylglutathione lyase family enzyme
MTLQRMDNVLIVVDDLEAAKAFFAELGMELEGETQVEGPWVDSTVGLNDVRADIAMMRTPDGHGRVELTKFHTPPAVRAEPESAPANALGIRRIMFAVDDLDDVVARLRSHGAELVGEIASMRTSTGSASCVALRASSSDWPSSSAETSMGAIAKVGAVRGERRAAGRAPVLCLCNRRKRRGRRCQSDSSRARP